MRSSANRGNRSGDEDGGGPLQRLGWSARDAVACTVGVCATGAILINVLFLQTGPHPAPIIKTSLLFPASAQSAQEATSNIGSTLPRVRPADPAPGKADALKSESAKADPQRTEPLKLEPAKIEPAKAEPAKTEPAKVTRATLPHTPGEIITEIQRELARRGFYTGSIDGFYGPGTDAAIRSFERAARLKPSTQPNLTLLNAIVKSNIVAKNAHSLPLRLDPPAPQPIERLVPPAPVPSEPSKRVESIQRVLAEFGYGQVAATGTVDNDTRAAIEKFEREKKLPVTGQPSERVAQELGKTTGRPLD